MVCVTHADRIIEKLDKTFAEVAQIRPIPSRGTPTGTSAGTTEEK